MLVMNNNELNVFNDTAFFTASDSYLRPRYPMVPEASAPVSEGLSHKFGQLALVGLLVLSVVLVLALSAARAFQDRPWHHAGVELSTDNPAETTTPPLSPGR